MLSYPMPAHPPQALDYGAVTALAQQFAFVNFDVLPGDAHVAQLAPLVSNTGALLSTWALTTLALNQPPALHPPICRMHGQCVPFQDSPLLSELHYRQKRVESLNIRPKIPK